MPDPRIRRTRPHGARHGRSPRADLPDDSTGLADGSPLPQDVNDAPASGPGPAADAGSDAASLVDAGGPAADGGRDTAAPLDAGAAAEAGAGVTDEAASAEEGAGATVAAAPAAATTEAGEAEETLAEDDEPVGWFRDEPIDDGVAAASSEPDIEPPVEPGAEPPVEPVSGGEPPVEPPVEPGAEPPVEPVSGGEPPVEPPVEPGAEPPVEPASGGDAFVRERDRPVVVPLEVAPPARRGSRVRGAVIGIVTIVAVAAVGFVAGLMLPTILPGPGLGTTPSPSVGPSATASPTPTPASTGTPTPAPTASPTAAPTPAPSQVVYIVKAGDQLARIAATYGVTVAAIQAANNIADPNLIKVGQKLIIPLPEATPAP